MAEEVGKVVHYYDKAGVAVVALTGTLNVGDNVTFERGEESFSQEVESMQIEHENVKQASGGTSVGLKVAQRVKPGAVVRRD